MKNRTRMQGLSIFLSGAAIALFICLAVTLAVGSHFVTAHESQYNYQMNDLIIYWKDAPWISLLGTVCALGAILAFEYMNRRWGKLRGLFFALWIVAAVCWITGVRVQPRTDPRVLAEAANAFAASDYSPLTEETYLKDFPFQLGVCLLMEILKRILPWADLVLVMQVLNILMIASAVYALSRLTAVLTKNEEMRRSAKALYLLFLPMLLYCIYVYGTIPMLMMSAWAALFFVRFLQNGEKRDGIRFFVCLGLAVMLKTNAMIVVITCAIVAMLHALNKSRKDVLMYAALGAGLSILLPECVVWLYEVRAGVSIGDGVSLLSYLVMGLQRCATGPGWYNGYVGSMMPSVIPPQEAEVIMRADLMEQLSAFAADPGMLWQFMKEKAVSMWLEPTYSTLYVGSLSELTGRFNGLGYLVYREESAFRLALEHMMDAYQQAVYILAAIGGFQAFRKRRDMAQAVLPIIILGGFLYHQLFEAKSQYIFVYAFFLMPLAAQGLGVLEGWLCTLHRRVRQK